MDIETFRKKLAGLIKEAEVAGLDIETISHELATARSHTAHGGQYTGNGPYGQR